ncbi:MAG: hydrogenase maturation protease [Planctomycetaceae bacterium]|nr:hydrogenase maturation protease [Planctomycetaceae bacterium]
MTAEIKVLLIGYGNPARGDDGLGPAVAEIIEQKKIPGVTVDSDYQLTVEDSAQVAENDVVIFVDASVDCAEPFSFEPLMAKESSGFSSHSVEPAEVAALAESLFNSPAKCFMLGIRGYIFEQFKEDMTEKAKNNLQKAVVFLENLLETKNFVASA